MKTLLVLMLTLCSNIYAESALPPVIDYSNYPHKSELGGATSSANFSYEISERLEQLQHEFQQLRGLVEGQFHALEKLKKQQKNIYSDVDQRFETQSQALTSLKKRQENIYTDLDQRLNGLDNFEAQKEDPVESIKQTPTNNSKSDSKVIQKAVTLAKENPVIAAEDIVVAVKNRQALYQVAYKTLKNGHNAEAISAFKSFLIDFPQGEFADNAQYWLAEAYKANQDFNSAKVAFLKVISDFSGSPKVPDALLTLGYIELAQNNKAKARDYLTQITSGYPKTEAARLAAKKIMQIKSM